MSFPISFVYVLLVLLGGISSTIGVVSGSEQGDHYQERWKTFTGRDNSFIVQHPSTWIPGPSDTRGAEILPINILFRGPTSQQDIQTQVEIAELGVSLFTTAQEAVQSQIVTLQDNPSLAKFEIKEPTDCSKYILNRLQGCSFMYEITFSDGTEIAALAIDALSSEGIEYIAIYRADVDVFKQFLPTAESIIKSFQTTDTDPMKVGLSTPLHILTIGSSGTEPGELHYPAGIALDFEGNLYVADWINDRIQKFAPDGRFLELWGSTGNGQGELDGPSDIALDQFGDVYVAELQNNRIQKFSPDGKPLEMWGSDGDDLGEFNSIEGITLDSDGNIYVADSGNNRIQKFDSNGQFVRTFETGGTGQEQFNYPTDVAIDSYGNIYVADSGNSRIQKLNSDGEFIRMWGENGTAVGQFYNPYGIDIDRYGNVFVADYGNDRIQKFTEDGKFLGVWGSKGKALGEFNRPEDISVDLQGNVYVADSLNDRIQVFKEVGNTSQSPMVVPPINPQQVPILPDPQPPYDTYQIPRPDFGSGSADVQYE